MNNCYFDKKNVKLLKNLMRCNDESNVSSQKRLCIVEACVDLVISAAVAVDIILFITTHADITVVIQFAVRIDERHMLIISICII